MDSEISLVGATYEWFLRDSLQDSVELVAAEPVSCYSIKGNDFETSLFKKLAKTYLLTGSTFFRSCSRSSRGGGGGCSSFLLFPFPFRFSEIASRPDRAQSCQFLHFSLLLFDSLKAKYCKETNTSNFNNKLRHLTFSNCSRLCSTVNVSFSNLPVGIWIGFSVWLHL